MFGPTMIALGAATLVIPMLPTAGEPTLQKANETTKMRPTGMKSDQEKILEHVHGIFEAYLQKDRETIRRSHTADWTGFGVGSVKMVQGIDGYMALADAALTKTRPKRYELLETDIQVHGDIAIVYYTANYWFLDADDHEVLLPLRSVDVYRREKDGWNQCGSNICRTPQPPNQANVPGGDAVSRPMSHSDRADLLAAREKVWRACFANDQAALRKLLPANVVAVNSAEPKWDIGLDSVLHGVAEFAKSGAKLVRLDFPRTEIQAVDHTATLYSTYEYVIEKSGRRETHRGRATEFFVKRGNNWLNTGWHLDSGS